MTTLTEFLLARIAEDEEQAEACQVLGWTPAKKYGFTAVGPARILAECAAKKAIISGAKPFACADMHEGSLRALATVYADHPDYQPEWAQEG